MKIINGESEIVPVDRLSRHPRNPRRGNTELIRESIDANGFYGAIVAQRSTGHILVGNHRYDAATAEGATEVPVIWLDVDDDRARRILLADNRTNDLAGYDETELAALLREIEDETDSLAGTGYDADALEALLAGLPSDGAANDDDAAAELVDRAQELRDKWGPERGQLWQVGRHRLLCGDATSADDASILLNGAKPQLMVTDPPYGVDYDPAWRARDGINKNRGKMGRVANDDRTDWSEAWSLFGGDVCYVWHPSWHVGRTQLSLESARFEIRALIVWRKDRIALSRGHYHWQHEPCWYAVRKGRTAGWIGDRSQSTIWDIPARDDDGHGHGTQKPLECMERPIRNHRGDVYEPFVGSGTAIVAAENLGRTCYAMDIDPAYVAVTLERLTAKGLEAQCVS